MKLTTLILVAAIISALLPSPTTVLMIWQEKPHLRWMVVASGVVALGLILWALD